MALSQLELQSVIQAPVMDHGTTGPCSFLSLTKCFPLCSLIYEACLRNRTLCTCIQKPGFVSRAHKLGCAVPGSGVGFFVGGASYLRKLQIIQNLHCNLQVVWQKPETCGCSKQKWWCVYEYLTFACAEMRTFTNELEVWRCTDKTAYRFFPSLLKEEIVHHDVFC